MGYVTAGPADGQPVVLLHGQATWSYLFRKMIPVFADAGLRVIAPDMVGFGRSDKPTQRSDHTSARHIEWIRALLFDVLDLKDITYVGQDWGGSIGLRLLAGRPERFSGIVITNAGLNLGDVDLPPAFWEFKHWLDTSESLDVSAIADMWTLTDLPADVLAAYDAPFPDESYKAAPRAMPSLVPVTPLDPVSGPNLAAYQVLGTLNTPLLCAFTEGDPIAAAFQGVLERTIPGAAGREHPPITGVGHLPQEDAGPRLAAHMVNFIRNR
jgi:haloalkane dehalogenase